MRLQRGKLERERLKHAAEHAFDYTAPPPPRNIQVISQLALPVSSRSLSSQKHPPKSAATSRDTSKIGFDKSGAHVHHGSRNFESYPSQVSAPISRTHSSLHSHMSPAVAAALAKVQAQQSILKFPEKVAAEDSELQREPVQQDAHAITFEGSPRHHQLLAAASPHFSSVLPQDLVYQIQAEQDFVEQLQVIEDLSAVHQNKGLDHAIMNPRIQHEAANIAATIVGTQHEHEQQSSQPDVVQVRQQRADFFEGIVLRSDGKQEASHLPLRDSGSTSEIFEQQHGNFERQLQLQSSVHSDRHNHAETGGRKVDTVSANCIGQLALLLDFDDNRYGDHDDVDAAHSHGHMIQLPNAEIGGSSSPGDSNYDNADCGLPEKNKFRRLRLKLPILDHPNCDLSGVGFQFISDDEGEQVTQLLRTHCDFLQDKNAFPMFFLDCKLI